MRQSDTVLLVKATLSFYYASLRDAFQGVKLNWRMLGMHLLYALALAVIAPFTALFGLAGGFMMGALLALVLGNYLATVAAAVDGERLSARESWERGLELFSPVISVLFMFFIVNIVMQMAFSTPETVWIKASINLFIAVLFNPIPEVIYSRGGSMGGLFSESSEFVKENFVEWFVPLFLLALPLLIITPGNFLPIVIQVVTTNPLYLIEWIILGLGNPLRLIYELPWVVLLLLCLYFALTFRGALYQRLAGSSRRKRIYQARNT